MSQVIIMTTKGTVVYGTLTEINAEAKAVKLTDVIDLSNCFKEIIPEPHDPSSLMALGPQFASKYTKLPRILPSMTILSDSTIAIVECTQVAIAKFAEYVR